METDPEASYYWEEAALEILTFGEKTIRKGYFGRLVPDISKSGIFVRSVGSNKGQIRDWRLRVQVSGKSIHVLEYTDRFVGHVDSFDPASQPIEHLLYDRGKDALKAVAESYIKRKLKGEP